MVGRFGCNLLSIISASVRVSGNQTGRLRSDQIKFSPFCQRWIKQLENRKRRFLGKWFCEADHLWGRNLRVRMCTTNSMLFNWSPMKRKPVSTTGTESTHLVAGFLSSRQETHQIKSLLCSTKSPPLGIVRFGSYSIFPSALSTAPQLQPAVSRPVLLAVLRAFHW